MAHREKAARRKAAKTHSVTNEEEEELLCYGGGLSELQLQQGSSVKKTLGRFMGSFAWSQRRRRLVERVAEFDPGGGQPLNYFEVSSLKESRYGDEVQVQGMEATQVGIPTMVEKRREESERPWYEEPRRGLFFGRDSSPYDLPLHISNVSKSEVHSKPTEEGSNPYHSSGLGRSESCEGSMGIEVQKYAYTTSPILPTATGLGENGCVAVHMSMEAGRVVVYWGEGEMEEEEEEEEEKVEEEKEEE